MVACQVAAQRLGWCVSFPPNKKAGIVLFSDSEKADFIQSCQLDLDGEDPLLVDLEQVEHCPAYWYQQACQFAPPF